MKEEEVISIVSGKIRKDSEREGSGHDWWHTYRVWNSAKYIARVEGANLYVVELGALLHDIADFKFHGGDTTVGAKKARALLKSLRVGETTTENVCEIVETVSFKGAGEEKPMRTLDGAVVRDADRLDALGAIGIARCFAYGGFKGVPIHLPDVKPHMHATKKEYVEKQTTPINHFYEKLLLLKDLMLTPTGKRLAEERHRFMEQYLEQFHREWNALG